MMCFHPEAERQRLPSADFWRGRRVLVLGHTGFKGAWLSLWLHRLGARVAGLALPPPTTPSLFALASLAELIPTLWADIRDSDSVLAAMQAGEPEVVLHLAAQSLVRRSYQAPVATYATNVMGTVNVLEAVRRVGSVRALVVVTSDKCYENRAWPWAYREIEPLGGHDPYSSSKACAELVTAAYTRSFFAASDPPRVGVATARAGNVIGGGDWAEDRLLPDCMRAFAAGHAVGIRNPDAIRPWQHVLDPLCGYLLLAERLAEDPTRYADAWNFGPDDADARPVAWVADRIVQRWGDASWFHERREGPHEASVLRLDASRARALLDWSPRLRLAEALDWTVDWYRHHNEAALALTDAQLARYCELVA